MRIRTQLEDFPLGTNILNVEVPDKLRKKISTGITYWDDSLGGAGFTPSCVTLFVGTPGAGKTTMMLELANALTRNGAMVMYNTAEESLYQLKMTVDRLNLRKGFIVGQETSVAKILADCDKLRAAAPDKPFFLIVDSLQTLNDGKYGDNVNSKTAERSLSMITDWCKQNYTNAIVIGQVTKGGQMAGSNVLKHMVDAMFSLDIERKEQDFLGCRILQTEKNRFGGSGHIYFLTLRENGFQEVSRITIG